MELMGKLLEKGLKMISVLEATARGSFGWSPGERKALIQYKDKPLKRAEVLAKKWQSGKVKSPEQIKRIRLATAGQNIKGQAEGQGLLGAAGKLGREMRRKAKRMVVK